MPDDAYLHLIAMDLARSADGQWWVLSDRTQAPSGAGYALENRIVLAETFPDLFREFEIQRVASFFRAFRDNMLRLSTSTAQQSPPGRAPHPRTSQQETYFEHSYLARYLGYTLAQGGDLTVRDSRVFLKTLEVVSNRWTSSSAASTAAFAIRSNCAPIRSSASPAWSKRCARAMSSSPMRWAAG